MLFHKSNNRARPDSSPAWFQVVKITQAHHTHSRLRCTTTTTTNLRQRVAVWPRQKWDVAIVHFCFSKIDYHREISPTWVLLWVSSRTSMDVTTVSGGWFHHHYHRRADRHYYCCTGATEAGHEIVLLGRREQQKWWWVSLA